MILSIIIKKVLLNNRITHDYRLKIGKNMRFLCFMNCIIFVNYKMKPPKVPIIFYISLLVSVLEFFFLLLSVLLLSFMFVVNETKKIILILKLRWKKKEEFFFHDTIKLILLVYSLLLPLKRVIHLQMTLKNIFHTWVTKSQLQISFNFHI